MDGQTIEVEDRQLIYIQRRISGQYKAIMYLPATACVRLVSWSLVRFWPAMTSWQELGEPLGRAEYRDASLELIRPSRACSPRLVLLLASVSSVWI